MQSFCKQTIQGFSFWVIQRILSNNSETCFLSFQLQFSKTHAMAKFNLPKSRSHRTILHRMELRGSHWISWCFKNHRSFVTPSIRFAGWFGGTTISKYQRCFHVNVSKKVSNFIWHWIFSILLTAIYSKLNWLSQQKKNHSIIWRKTKIRFKSKALPWLISVC